MENPINFMIRPQLAILLQRANDITGKDKVTKKDPSSGKTTQIFTCDPYCWVRFYDRNEKLLYEEKTEVLKETTNPQWNYKIEPFENFAIQEETKDKLQGQLSNIQIQLFGSSRFLDEFLGQVVLATEGKDKIILDDETHPLETKKKKGGGIETMPGNLVITFRYKTGQQLEREAKEAKELAIKKRKKKKKRQKKNWKKN